LYNNILKPVAELDGAGAFVAFYVYGSKTSIPDYVIRDSNIYRVGSDILGSPRIVANSTESADVPVRADYAAFGQVTGTGHDWMPFGFAGGHFDPDTGLVRFGARDYDPTIGRWVSKDPARFEGGANPYVYVENDPIERTDPFGLYPTYEQCAGIGNAYTATCILVGCVPVAPGIVSGAACVLVCAGLGQILNDECNREREKRQPKEPSACGSSPSNTPRSSAG
jgi:RHS repeat-associated protein